MLQSVIPMSQLEGVVNSILDVNGLKEQKPWRDRVSDHRTLANELYRNISSQYGRREDSKYALF